MQLIKYPIEIVLVTVSDINDPKGILHELSEHGKVIGSVFTTETNKVRGGAFLWKHKKLGRDKFILTIISGVPKLSEGNISKRGIFNLKKFHENYPIIPIIDIGVSIDASEIVRSADKAIEKINNKVEELKKLGKKYKGDLSKQIKFHDFGELKELIKKLKKKRKKTEEDEKYLKELEEELELQEKVNKFHGFTTREVKLGAIITEDDSDFNKIVEQLSQHTGSVKGKKELWAGRFSNEDIGLILWHREQMGYDTYWIFLVLDKDSIKSGKLLDWEGPDIKEFKKTYGSSMPIIEIPKIKTEMAIETSTILNKLERKKKSGKLRIK